MKNSALLAATVGINVVLGAAGCGLGGRDSLAGGVDGTAQVAVIPTKSVLQAFAAMFVVADGVPFEELVEEMTDAISGVRYGEVTTAVRDSSAADGTPIHNERQR